MNLFENNIFNTVKEYSMILTGDRIVAALSGGADSSALLLVLKKLSEIIGFELCAAHLNHGIRGEEAIRDMEFSASLAASMGIPFFSECVSVPDYSEKKHISEEMAGRELRYKFFDEICRKYHYNKIAVAHNLNDSAETILMNLLRGSGSAGLKGIAPVNNNIVRPLIKASRADIEKYLEDNCINYVTDSTNKADIYNRNIVRNKIFPEMLRINSEAVNNIVKCSRIISAENDFLAQHVKSLNAIKIIGDKAYLNRQIFNNQHIAVKRQLIYESIKLLKGNTVNFLSIHAEAIINNDKTGNVIQTPGGILILFECDNILFVKNLPYIEEYEYKVSIPGKLNVTETNLTYSFQIIDELKTLEHNSVYINLDNADLNSIILRTRKNGDLFYPSGMMGSKKIKTFFIDNKIPQHERNRYPLLVVNNKIAAVLPIRVSRDFTIDDNTSKILKITVTGGNDE